MLTNLTRHHLSDETLVSMLDGELAPRKRRAVHRHLDRCWECRTRMTEFESQIQHFTRLLREQNSPPPAWVYRAREKFQERARFIREMAELEARPRRASWLVLPRLNPGFTATAAACLMLAVLLHWLHSPARVSAHELLSKAVASDLNATRVGAGKLIRQRVRVSRKSLRTGQEMSVLRDCWFGGAPPAVPATDNSLMDELRAVYHDNGLDWNAPLAVAGIVRWHSGLRDPFERVSLDNEFVLTVEDRSTTAVPNDRHLRLIRVYLRQPDLHPVRQELETAEARYGVSEVSYSVVDSPATVRTDLSPVLPQIIRGPRQSNELLATEHTNPLADRIEVEFALHQAGACQDATVTVENLAAGGVAVRGPVNTDEEKQQLLMALGSLRAVRTLELHTLAEAARSVSPAPDEVLHPAAPSASMVFHSTSFALEKPLRTHFLKQGTPESARDKTGLLIDSLLGSISGAAREAAALKRLAETYPAAQLANLPDASRQLLSKMVRAHGQRLEQDLKDTYGRFSNIADALGVESTDTGSLAGDLPAVENAMWEGECASLPESLRQLEAHVWELLTHSSGLVEETRELTRQVGRRIQESSRRVERLMAAADMFGDRVETARKQQ